MKNLEVKKLRHGAIKPRMSEILPLQVLENLSGADAGNWTTIEHRINEVASNMSDNTVYVWHWHKSLNTTFDLEFEQNVVTRLAFNDAGKVIAIGDLSEERLAQSQLGFSLTR